MSHVRSRIIVVREPDGSLRTCSWEEKDRVNQIYFPKEGRRHYTPQMFEPEQLEIILGPEKYEYILDRSVQLSLSHTHQSSHGPSLGTVSNSNLIIPSTSGLVRLFTVILTSINILIGSIPPSESFLVIVRPSTDTQNKFTQALRAHDLSLLLDQDT